jgi:hypothetical protein
MVRPVRLLGVVFAALYLAGGLLSHAAAQGGPPAAPTDLQAVVVEDRLAIYLSWQDNADDETSYVVERSTDGAGGPWHVRATLAANSADYLDEGLEDGVTYWYRVAAVNAAGSSGFSNVVPGTASALPSGPVPTPSATAALTPTAPESIATASLPATGRHIRPAPPMLPWLVAAAGGLLLLTAALRLLGRR